MLRELSDDAGIVYAECSACLWTGSPDFQSSHKQRTVDIIMERDLPVMTPTSTNTNQVKPSFTVHVLHSYSNMFTGVPGSNTHFESGRKG